MKRLSLLLGMFLTLNVKASTQAFFMDSCSEKETKVSTPNGLNLAVRISGLNPQERINLSITFKPAVSPELIKPHDQTTWNYSYGSRSANWRGRSLTHINQHGVFESSFPLPNQRWMRNISKKLSGFNIWDAEINWNQLDSKKSGSFVTSFYNSPTTGPYFQVVSERICYWEGEASISSKLYENNSAQNLLVVKQVSQIWEQGTSTGMTLGHNNFQGNLHPMAQFSLSSTFLGWMFKDWQTQNDTQQSSSIERSYTLKKNEAGVFISRLGFNRHQVKRYSWDENAGQCGNFVEDSTGFLDVGNMKDGDFVVIPKHLTGKPQKINEFIKRSVPTIKNCTGSPGEVSDVIPSGNNGMLYYYIQ